MARMKGMHGVCLHPGRAIVELKVRAYNRTPFVQTFLWWSNVATRVHEGYQSFFPPDVAYVADHARRSISEYPLAKGIYYGVNYAERGRKGVPQSQLSPYPPNDLSWYANIPTPCSYMSVGSSEDFFGGYDHFAEAGIVHIADHHISPGKKQWTWGNHHFGYAWNRNLTEKDSQGKYAPYIELMAGVFTDNQPDFSFLQPGETKSWSQFWYPIQKIGVAQKANLDAALSFARKEPRDTKSKIRIGVSVTRNFRNAQIKISNRGKTIWARACDLALNRPFVEEFELPGGLKESDLTASVSEADGREIVAYTPRARKPGKAPLPATEPPAPQDIPSADELFITGLHLEQYRHATRCPTLYWREALRRDPLDARCNNALGLWHLRRGEFQSAETHFRNAIERITHRNANPYDGEPYYNFGLCLRYRLDAKERRGHTPSDSPTLHPSITPVPRLFDSAYAALYKATWNQAWQSAAYHALAELDCRKANWDTALEHLNHSLSSNTENTRARDLKALILQNLGRGPEAELLLRETLALDPLDWWARHLLGEPVASDLQVSLDLAHDCARAGFYAPAIALLEPAVASARDLPDQSLGAAPLIHYTLGWLHEQAGDIRAAQASFERAALQPPDYCCPARLEELAVLEAAIRANPRDARAPYYLGNWFYDRRRHAEGIRQWERSAKLDPSFSVVWRNLGIGYFNIFRQPSKALAAYEKAFRADPGSARVLFERDQLWKRVRRNPARRLRELQQHPQLVRQRDDLSVELCDLYNQTGQHAKALELVSSRKFQPWEGGEGAALGQHVRSHLALGREALARGDAQSAHTHFTAALDAPENLGEAKHLLANQSDLHYSLGLACQALGDKSAARKHWLAAATFKGDFQGMSVRSFSEMTYYSALAWERLGQKARAKALLRELLAYALKLQKAEAKIDYFATSLPAMLLFEDDLQFRQETTALFLQAQAHLGLGKLARAKTLLARVLKRDPNHALAADLVTVAADGGA
jgi:tetratricopeptide (TPR) repeat protein